MKSKQTNRRILGAVVETMELQVLMSAGWPDTSYGVDGIATAPTTALLGTGDGGTGLVIPVADGKVIAIGTDQEAADTEPVLSRFNSDGSLDTTFGNDGVARHDLVEANQTVDVFATSAVAEPDGKIVVVGYGFSVSGESVRRNSVVVERYNADGSFDTSFNPLPALDYYFGKAGPDEQDIPVAAAVQTDGKIVLIAASTGGRNPNLGVLRLNSDGSIDTTFGYNDTGSRLLFAAGSTDESLAIDSLGRILIGGSTPVSTGGSIVTGGELQVTRLTSSGAIDTTFGNAGTASSAALAGQAVNASVAVQANGTILVAGTDEVNPLNPNTASYRSVVAAFNDNGTIDSAYATAGVYEAPNPIHSTVLGMLIQPDGKALLLNTFPYDSPQGYSITRLTTAGQLDDSFGTAGVTTVTGAFTNVQSLAFSPDTSGGKIYLGLFDNNSGASTNLHVSRLTDDVPATITTPAQLTGTLIGTSRSYRNQGNTAANAFDGNLSTFFDAPTASGSWAGLDLGSPMVVTSISYAPRSGWANRMVGGMFQASNSPSFSSGVVTLYTVTATPATGVLTTVAVSNTLALRYVRYIGPANSYCNIAEAEFFGTVPAKFTGAIIGTTGSYENQGNVIANVFDGNLSTFFDAPNGSGDWVGLDLGLAQVVTEVEYAPRSGWAGRMVGGEIQASNSASFSTGVVTLYTITSTPATGVLTTQLLTNTTAYRYYRYIGPANSFCNIAELEFFG